MREFVQVPPGFRQMLEELADLAVLLLDELDGDVDLEDGGDNEPWLAGSQSLGAALDAEEDAGGQEPSLGSFDRMVNQENWSKRTADTWAHHDSELDLCDDENNEGEGDDSGLDEQVRRHLGNGLRFLPADAEAVADARHRLGAIMDRVGGGR